MVHSGQVVREGGGRGCKEGNMKQGWLKKGVTNQKTKLIRAINYIITMCQAQTSNLSQAFFDKFSLDKINHSSVCATSFLWQFLRLALRANLWQRLSSARSEQLRSVTGSHDSSLKGSNLVLAYDELGFSERYFGKFSLLIIQTVNFCTLTRFNAAKHLFKS